MSTTNPTEGMTAAEVDLLRLKNATERWGVLSEIQVLNLRYWFKAVTTDFYEDFDIGWDYEKQIVEYRLKKVNEKKIPKKLDSRFGKLTQAVRWLLGDGYKVRVKAGKKYLWKSSDVKTTRT